MTHTCIFCKIANNQIQAKKHFQNEHLMVIDDINPQAKVHALIIPLKHIQTMADIHELDRDLCLEMFKAVREVRALLAPKHGFRIACNNGTDAGQTVNHLHWHFLSDC